MFKSSSRPMQRFAKRRALRGFGWETLIKPWTPASTVDRFKFAESDILNKKKYANSVPSNVEEIDWAYWNSAISAPGVVAELKKQYEEHVFTDQDPNVDVEGAKDVEAEIFDLKVKSKIANVELKSCDDAINGMVRMKTDMLNWHINDWYAKIPGLEEELLEEWQQEIYVPMEEEERTGQLDYTQLAKDVAKGKLDTDPYPKPERIGDLTLEEIEQAKADGTWTIATWMKPKAEREKLYAARKKLVDETAAALKA